MAPRVTAAASAARSLQDPADANRWVTVSWMPHASLSQSSYIALSVRSMVACVDDTTDTANGVLRSSQKQPQDLQVSVTIHGIAGLELIPVSSMTEFAPLLSISESSKKSSASSSSSSQQQQQGIASSVDKNNKKQWSPLVSTATHRCQWDNNSTNNSMVHIPLRWRDLPRDAYLKFQVTGSNDQVVR